MRTNTRPPIILSELHPQNVWLKPGEPLIIACPDCDRPCVVRRGLLKSHFLEDGVTDCGASAQRVKRDLTPEAQQRRLAEGVLDAGRRSGGHAHEKPRIPKGSAPSQLGTVQQRRVDLDRHRKHCRKCTRRFRCTEAELLHRRIRLAEHVAGCGTCNVGRPCRTSRVLGDELAWADHSRRCGRCHQDLPDSNCSAGGSLFNRVTLRRHRRDCTDCWSGNPCTEGKRLRARVDVDNHHAHCKTCQQGGQCKAGKNVRQELDIRVRDQQAALAEQARRAAAPRRYAPKKTLTSASTAA